MATTVNSTPTHSSTRAATGRDDFDVVVSATAPDRNLPHRMADRLWAPMLAMGTMGLVIGLALAVGNANAVAGGQAPADIARLGHIQTGVTFIGFTGVFSGVVLAIARILGTFRIGGAQVQAGVGRDVQTVRMPATAKAMIALMAMGMMALVVPVIAHFWVAGSVVGPTAAALLRAEEWAITLEAVRRVGVSLYLASIALGLATIIHVLRFQAVRVRELARAG